MSLKPIKVFWYCTKCHHTTIQILTNDPPIKCPTCGELPIKQAKYEHTRYGIILEKEENGFVFSHMGTITEKELQVSKEGTK